MQNLVSQPYLFIINVSSVIIHSIINTSFIYIKDFDTVSIAWRGGYPPYAVLGIHNHQ